MNRRSWIKWTVTSTVALTSGVVGLQFLQEEDFSRLEKNQEAFSFLSQQDQLLLLAILPVMLGKQYEELLFTHQADHFQLLKAIDTTIQYFPSGTQDELRDLFDLLYQRLGKLLLAGIWASWTTASGAAIESFLEQWRNSWLLPLNQGYTGLQQLVMAAFFADKKHWSICEYPGPPF